MTRTIHVVYDVSYPFIEGGGQKRIFEIAKRLVNRGWDIRWFTFKTWDGPQTIQKDGITYTGLEGYVPLYSPSGRRSWREALAFGRAVWVHRRMIRRADVLWCGQWPYSHLISLMHGTKARLYVDWWETWGKHWFEYFGTLGATIGYVGERLFATLCTRYGNAIAISPRGVRELLAAGAKPESVRLIPNGINMSDIEIAIPTSDGADIIYVGRLKDHKNVDHILEALYLLRRDHGQQLNADIIGAGPEEGNLRALVDELGLNSTVRFRGAVDEKGKFAHLKSASIFVHPSTKEGGGSLTVHESHACGVPVMIYDSPQGIDPGYILEGRTGWIVTPASPGAMAKRLAQLLATEGRPLRSRARECQIAAEKHDWNRIAEQYHELFAENFVREEGSTHV